MIDVFGYDKDPKAPNELEQWNIFSKPMAEKKPVEPDVFELERRDIFAAMAMQGLLSGGQLIEPHGERDSYQHTAYMSVVLADALIDELAKERT